MGRSVLVSGGLGYVGSHTVVELQQAGYDVSIIDNLSNSYGYVVDQITKISGKKPTFIQLDLSNEEHVLKYISLRHDINMFIHFAACKSVNESVHNPLKYYRNNLCSLIHILSAFSKRELRLVFSSSCTVYGQPDVLPVTEDAPMKAAVSPYGSTKQMSEQILRDIARVHQNYHIISLRYFNPVGAHPSSLIGELSLGAPESLVPIITQSAIGKRGPLIIHGNDYRTPDGTCIRDYVHVVDLAKAHVSALHYLESQPHINYEAFNIGLGKGTSVLEVIRAFEYATGIKLPYAIGPRRPGDIAQIWADVNRAKNKLKWGAVYNLYDMMKSAWEWEKNFKNIGK